jgi:protein FRG1
MVTKLKFKGEKHKKRKRDHDDPEAQGTSAHGAGEEEEGWIDAESLEDISSGPLFVTFASSPPIALAIDPFGKVHAAPLKLKAEEEDLAHAEPDDVKQVWIATKLAGSSKISLKTASGKFLSCDRIGVLSASKEAIGAQEEWLPVQREDGWALQNVFDKFLYILPQLDPLTV